MTDGLESPKRKKGRSPSYPGINLEAAIERARELWDRENKHPVPVHVAMGHWGYQSATGPGAIILAALRKFGLLEYEGSGNNRRAKLTDRAIRILRSPHEPERQDAIKEAALAPSIVRELWEKYQGSSLPSDDALGWELETQRQFTQSGAAEFIPVFRDTIAFARLVPGDSVTTQKPQGETEDEADEDELPPEPKRRRVRRMSGDENAANVLTVPLMGGAHVIVEGEFPITEQDWDQFMAVLNAMKPGLVREVQPDEDD